MAESKHRANAPELIGSYIDALPDWSHKICTFLRKIILKSDPKIIEDWKWGPNFYLDGKVCNIAATKKHVNLVFFKGTHLNDKRKLLQGNPGNLNIRSFRFKDVKEINEDIILEYLIEAIDNNKKGIKLNRAADRTVIIPAYIKKQFKSAGVLTHFETRSYTHRKTYIQWIENAKKEETRQNRMERAIDKLSEKAFAINYKK